MIAANVIALLVTAALSADANIASIVRDADDARLVQRVERALSARPELLEQHRRYVRFLDARRNRVSPMSANSYNTPPDIEATLPEDGARAVDAIEELGLVTGTINALGGTLPPTSGTDLFPRERVLGQPLGPGELPAARAGLGTESPEAALAARSQRLNELIARARFNRQAADAAEEPWVPEFHRELRKIRVLGQDYYRYLDLLHRYPALLDRMEPALETTEPIRRIPRQVLVARPVEPRVGAAGISTSAAPRRPIPPAAPTPPRITVPQPARTQRP